MCAHVKNRAHNSTGERGIVPRRKTNLGADTNQPQNFGKLEIQRVSSHKNWAALSVFMV
jgi:hypothetical protein